MQCYSMTGCQNVEQSLQSIRHFALDNTTYMIDLHSPELPISGSVQGTDIVLNKQQQYRCKLWDSNKPLQFSIAILRKNIH